MTLSAPSSRGSRLRGRLSTAPSASRRKHSSIASTASPGESRPSTSDSVRYRGRPRSLFRLGAVADDDAATTRADDGGPRNDIVYVDAPARFGRADPEALEEAPSADAEPADLERAARQLSSKVVDVAEALARLGTDLDAEEIGEPHHDPGTHFTQRRARSSPRPSRSSRAVLLR